MSLAMKRILIVIAAFLYLGTSTGAIVHLHYCMGKLVDWGLGYDNSNTCSKCGMEKSLEKDNGCCKEEHKFIKNVSDQKTTQSNFQVVQLIAVAPLLSFVEMSSTDFPSITEENLFSHASPRSSGVAAYVRNCVFLI